MPSGPEPELWIVTGVPGAGKSTTARALMARTERGVHIEGDALQRLIVSGSVPPRPEGTSESERQINLNVRNQCLLARSFLDEGFAVAIDYVVTSRARLRAYVDLLSPYPARFVMLAPDLAVSEERDRSRREKRVLPDWRHLIEEMRAELTGVGLWVDTGALSVDQVVGVVTARVAEAVIDSGLVVTPPR